MGTVTWNWIQGRSWGGWRTGALWAAAAFLVAGPASAQSFTLGGADDPRVGLGAGWFDAEEASWNMNLLATLPKPDGFYNPEDPGDSRFANSDLAFQENLVFVGNYHGINIYDISDPANPVLHTSIVCPGGQGDVSVFGDLLVMSVQETRSRIDCGTEGTAEDPVDPERFRGVRIFDISNLDNPTQIAAVQTCRGSHTHTLVTDPGDAGTLYVYNSGTSAPRPSEELAGCVDERDPDLPDTSYWSIDIIEVPLSAPEQARLIDSPRVFADAETGRIDGLFEGGDHGEGTQETRPTDRCHDITSYPEIGLALGACSGNGLLFDISDPARPVRIDAVVDPNFAFWHSATFNNDGTTVIFTDEWGGGTSPRCLETDRYEWGANTIFSLANGRMHHASYYKMPAAQTETENCVAHNGSLVPVPGRDIKVQAWYQGGVSVFDFTDPENPVEIAFFDRGPISDEELYLGGHWSAYWHNGYIYGSEIARGLDVFELTPSEHLTENELEAARLVHFEEFNPQHQPRIVWPADFSVARALHDQLVRHDGISTTRASEIAGELGRLEAMASGPERRAALSHLATEVWADARRVEEGQAPGDAERIRRLAGAILDLAGEEGA
jgi:hypothetical protein